MNITLFWFQASKLNFKVKKRPKTPFSNIFAQMRLSPEASCDSPIHTILLRIGLREDIKNILREVLNSAWPSAAHVIPPFFGSPLYIPPFLSALVSTPPIFEVDHLHPPFLSSKYKVIFTNYIYAFCNIFNASKLHLFQLKSVIYKLFST